MPCSCDFAFRPAAFAPGDPDGGDHQARWLEHVRAGRIGSGGVGGPAASAAQRVHHVRNEQLLLAGRGR